MNTDPVLDSTREWLARCRRVAAFSGAGLSADSGLATFRDPDTDALWSRFDPTKLASPHAFAADPELVIDWYNWRRRRYAEVAPNAAHRTLAAQADMVQITQNVDHLLEAAGADSGRVLHLHGSILSDRCHNDGCDYRETIDPALPPGLRDCLRCGTSLRPAVVWFGETLPTETWARAQSLCTRLDCLLVIGTSATVYPAAGLIELTRQNGGRIIVVDPNASAASDVADSFLQGRAAELLPRLLDGLALRSID